MKKNLSFLVVLGFAQHLFSGVWAFGNLPDERFADLAKEFIGVPTSVRREDIHVLNHSVGSSTLSSGNSVPGKWRPSGGIGGCNGVINAVVVAPSGMVYLGGSFTVCGNVAANRVAVYDPVDDTFHALADGILNDRNPFTTVYALALFQGDLYVGGAFEFADDADIYVGNVARWDGVHWHALRMEGNATGVGGSVHALTASEHSLYIGGEFPRAGGMTVNRIASWDGEAWDVLESGEQIGVDGSVYALAYADDGLYVGGGFDRAGDVRANNVAYWDGASWHTLGHGVDGGVRALAITDREVFAGGHFGEAGDVSVRNIARWDGENWNSLARDADDGTNGPVDALAIVGNKVYIGGDFLEAGGLVTHGAAYWDGISWNLLEGDLLNGVGGTVSAFAVRDDGLYIGGKFGMAGDAAASNIVHLDRRGWSALASSGNNGMAGWSVNTLTVAESGLYVGGNFVMIGGVAANGVAHWNGEEWRGLGVGELNGVNGGVNAIEVVGDKVYVGGDFTEAGGRPAQNIAYWDGGNWHALSGSEGEGLSNTAHSLALWKGKLYVGGSFSHAGGKRANQIARWDGAEWHVLDDNGSIGIYNYGFPGVFALSVYEDSLYVGGRFSGAGAVQASNIARWDGENWFSLYDEEFEGVHHEFDYPAVFSLASSDHGLYVGGAFNLAGDVEMANLARWEGGRWHDPDTGWFSREHSSGGWATNSYVRAVLVSEDHLYVGGWFGSVGGARAQSVARWDGTSWASLGIGDKNGVSGEIFSLFSIPVTALAVMGDSVYVGGNFLEAGGEASYGFAEFLENPDFRIETGHTSLWFSPERAGEGWVLEILDDEIALFYWFTFDEASQQRWMMDVGRIDGNRIVFEEMHFTRGGRPGQTDPGAVERPIAGEAVMTFTDCENGALEYRAFDQRQVINFQRLTRTANLPCGDEGSVVEDSRAGLTGTWFDPAHAGEGFIVQWMAHGEAVLIWFTFDNAGNQQWVLGTGQESGGEIVFSDLHTAHGARFGTEFDPDEVTREDWGVLRLSLDCESGAGTVRWDSVHPEFGSGELNVQPLTRPQGVICSTAD